MESIFVWPEDVSHRKMAVILLQQRLFMYRYTGIPINVYVKITVKVEWVCPVPYIGEPAQDNV